MKRAFRLFLYLLSVHVAALVLLSVLRLVLYIVMSEQVGPETASVWPAFLRGVWFDNVVACYVMLPALVAALVATAVGYFRRPLLRGLNVWFGVLYSLVLMCSAANIPYFAYFSRTLNSSIWEWKSYVGQTAGMVLGEASWRKYILLYIVLVALFSFLLWWLGRRTARQLERVPVRGRWKGVALLLPLIGLCIFGIRGRMGYNPIKVSAAYYCDNAILNQLGINPAFCLLRSTLDDARPENQRLHLMDDNEAVRNVQAYLGREGIAGVSPIARRIQPEGEPTRKNVVVVLMESMSAKLMGRFGNPDHLTPHLDSLYQHSLSFANFYSAGNHTNNGIFSTLYGFPSILKRNAMKGTVVPRYEGLPTVLRDKGYSTLFFMTHEAQYDNMNAFLRTNGFEEIYSQENYPREKIANHFGVADDYLFSYALPILRRKAESGRPFFATLLTISNHPPYIIQPYFHPRHKDPQRAIVEYADWAVGEFMKAAAREPWFKNTIFVFLGDHGKKLGADGYEVEESFNHIPLIIYNSGLPTEERHDFAGQIDVGPTLLGLLRLPYVQRNFGIDLLRERRDMMFYCADEVMCARDANHLYIYNPSASRDFCYDTSRPGFHPVPMSAPYRRLKKYLFSNLQASEKLK